MKSFQISSSKFKSLFKIISFSQPTFSFCPAGPPLFISFRPISLSLPAHLLFLLWVAAQRAFSAQLPRPISPPSAWLYFCLLYQRRTVRPCQWPSHITSSRAAPCLCRLHPRRSRQCYATCRLRRSSQSTLHYLIWKPPVITTPS